MPRSAASTRLVTRDMGKSGSFDGTTSYCTVPITPSTTAFSFGMWLKIGRAVTNNTRILDWQDSGPTNGFTLIALVSGGRISFGPELRNSSTLDGIPTKREITADEWVHTVVTYEANNLNFYINGSLFSQDTSITMTASSATLTLARRAPSAANFYKGLIDGFVFLNGRAMTATEVATLYSAGLSPTDRTCHIRFNDSVNDEAPTTNNLTATGLTYSTDVPIKTRSVATTRLAASTRTAA